MNFDCTKDYGDMIREAVEAISSFNDIYKAAESLSYDMRHYLLASRLAFAELYMMIEHQKEIVSRVIDKYVLSFEVDKYIFNNPHLEASDANHFAFIEHDCGDFFDLIQNIKLDLFLLDVIAHPSDYDEKTVSKAVYEIVRRIEPTLEMQNATKSCLESLRNEAMYKQQDNNKEVNNVVKKENKYAIIHEKRLFVIYDYLTETKVVSNDITFPTFRNVIETADASLIKPKTKWKYNAALSLARECITGDTLAWTREVCASLNIASNGLTQNIDKLAKWYKELENRIKAVA